ncbi:MAG: galactokinase [Bacteroidia bacterium]|nr:galactokinase [Bacteroidia bacterium]
MDSELINIVKAQYKRTFGDRPLLVFSPGRINLIGEHTDYNNGFVMPAAIDKGIAMALSVSKESNSTIISKNFKETIELDINDKKLESNNHWSDYIRGVVLEFQKLVPVMPQIKAVIGSDLPIGAGMSSSAAILNAISFGLNLLFDLGLDKLELARLGRKAENKFVGVQSGLMDQFTGLFGKKEHLIILDCQSLDYKFIKWPFNGYSLILVDSMVRRDLKNSSFNQRKQNCSEVAGHFGKNSLRDLDMIQLDKRKNEIKEEKYRQARFVLNENQRVHDASKAIINAEMDTLGQLMIDSHHGLKNEYEVSCDQLDFLVESLIKHKGVKGARMMGGGFGGCTINLIKEDEIPGFQIEIQNKYQRRLGKTCHFYDVNLSDGTHQIIHS